MGSPIGGQSTLETSNSREVFTPNSTRGIEARTMAKRCVKTSGEEYGISLLISPGKGL